MYLCWEMEEKKEKKVTKEMHFDHLSHVDTQQSPQLFF
jgi:hypothetical protein